MITFRKTKQGQWVVFGPADSIATGATVTVTKKDGTTSQVRVDKTGREFSTNNGPMVYGYFTKTQSPRQLCDNCGELSSHLRERQDMSGIVGLACVTCSREPQSLSFA